MDSNLKIIQHVQKRPILYAKTNNFDGRAKAWKEIADILKTDEHFVKSRWHLLRTRFIEEYSSVMKGNSTPFKYLSEMSFLTNHLNSNAFDMYSKENEIYTTEPEFNISQKDLDQDSEDDSSSEFIELDLDEESQSEMAQIPFEGTEEDKHNDYIEPIYIEDYSSNSQQHEIQKSLKSKHKQQETFVETKALQKSEPKRPQLDKSSSEKPTSDNHSPKIVTSKKLTPEKSTTEKMSPAKTVPQEIKTEITRENLKENANKIIETQIVVDGLEEPSKRETPPVIAKPEVVSQSISDKAVSIPKPDNYRCEDTIFGELVTATLREMQADKKKAVKREIMNLLFT